MSAEPLVPASGEPGAGLKALGSPRWEMVPMRGIEEAVELLPPGSTVTVTCSPTRGLDASLTVVADLARRGHRPVPHLAARMVSGADHLTQVVQELDRLGVRDVFVIAGDAATPAGPYEGAADLLEEMHRLGHPFAEVGVTGYPESHSFIPDGATITAMAAKAPYATYLVSQICYDAEVVRRWVDAVRARGITLPLHLGIPGVVDRTRLLRVSARIGLADSVRFLKRQTGVAVRAAAGFTPDHLVTGLGPLFEDPGARVVGWHLFTFNEIARTEQWRRALLAGKEKIR